VKVQLLDIDYTVEDEDVTVRVYGKNDADEAVKIIDRDFKPYFYAVPQEDADIGELKENVEDRDFQEDSEQLEVTEVEVVEKKITKEERSVLRIQTTIPPNVPKLKNKLWDMEAVRECREFDIPFYRRYMIDKNLRTGEWYKIEAEEVGGDFQDAYQLESWSEGGKEILSLNSMAFDLEVYEDEVIMISTWSENGQNVYSTEDIDREFVTSFESEQQMIQAFIDYVNEEDFDLVLGYNTDEYDFQVLRERAEDLNLTLSLSRNGERMKFNRRGRFSGARLKGRPHLDLYAFVSHVLGQGMDSETLDLDSVAEELLDMNKDDMSWEEMKQNWEQKENLEEFAEYALKDSEIAYQLGEQIVPQILELARITGLTPFDACRLTYGQLTENYLIREAYRRDILVENRPSQDKRRKRQRQGAYSGGFVYTPDAGLYEDLVTLDFRSLYPTVIVAHNISPDTLNVEECSDSFEMDEFDYTFCQDEEGFFPELVRNLVEDRYEIKSEMKEKEEGTAEHQALYSEQQAKKILANSFYGYLGYNGARWYSRESAEATTYLGRKYIEDTIEDAEQEGFEVVYGDTDSVFLQKDNIMRDIDGFLDRVNDNLPEFMELEFEGFFKRGFFTSTESGEGAKKKYALMDEDGGLKITGFEQVRRDWCPLAKQTQKEVLRKVLEDKVEEALQTVIDTVERLREGEVDTDELRIYTTLTKPPEEYGSTAPHVEAVKKAEERGDEIEPETTIAYVVTRGSGNISSRAELLKYAENYDPEYYVDNQIIPVAYRVLKEFGYSKNRLKGEATQSGLGRFS
jgi:DNA polymerase I